MTHTLIAGVLWLLVGLLALPALVLLVQVVAAAPVARRVLGRPAAGPLSSRTKPRPRIAVVVPAHNEAEGISDTLQSIQAQLAESDVLLVVADNCSDSTAHVARTLGAAVVERRDSQRIGKGYALDHGLRHLEQVSARGIEVVCFVDADCVLRPGSLDALADAACTTGLPAQAINVMHAPSEAPLQLRLAEMAWRLKNVVRPIGWARLGCPCQVLGTGTALPWRLATHAALATDHLAEDLQLGLDLALAGHPAVLCQAARVDSMFPSTTDGARLQHTRWEHGHIDVIFSRVPGLLWYAISRVDAAVLTLSLDLVVPPLGAYALAIAVLVGVTTLAATLNLGQGPLLGSLLIASTLLLAVLVAWVQVGRGLVTFTELAGAPWYALRKLPMYFGILLGRRVPWTRSDRGK